MSSYTNVIRLCAVLLLLQGLLIWTGCGKDHSDHAQSSPRSEQETQKDSDTKWTCAMHPEIRMEDPGNCPLCGMELEPVSDENQQDEQERSVRLSLSDHARKMANIKTAPVRRKYAQSDVRLYGEVTTDETRTETISAWVPGRLDRLFVDFQGKRVREGDPMVQLWSPKILTTLEDLIQSRKTRQNASTPEEKKHANQSLNSIRKRLRNWGLTSKQIKNLAREETAQRHITLKAPTGGVVMKKHRQEGEYVKTGTPIYTIANLSRVWVELEAYEKDLPWIRYGQNVTITTDAHPGETFRGRVSFVNPTVNPNTRTTPVRIVLKNPDRQLKPGMYATGKIHATINTRGNIIRPEWSGKYICPHHPNEVSDTPGKCEQGGEKLRPVEAFGYARKSSADPPLVIPETAPLITGERAVVYVEKSDDQKHSYEARNIQLGAKAGRFYIVKSGLREGEQVVVNGNFNIDSELQIQNQPSMMYEEQTDKE